MTDTPSPAQAAIAEARVKARQSRFIEAIIAAVTLLAVIVYGQVTISHESATLAQVRATQSASHQTGLTNEHILTLLEDAVGPAATQRSQAATTALILCVTDVINNNTNVDTGKPVQPLPKGCTP